MHLDNTEIDGDGDDDHRLIKIQPNNIVPAQQLELELGLDVQNTIEHNPKLVRVSTTAAISKHNRIDLARVLFSIIDIGSLWKTQGKKAKGRR